MAKEESNIAQHLLPAESPQDKDVKEDPLQTAEPRGEQKRVGLFTRLLPLLSAMIASILSIVLLIADVKRWYFSGYCDGGNTMACWVEYDRPSIAVVVQIIGTVLGALWTLSVTTAFNLTVRSKLTGSRTNVERLRLYISLSRKAVDLSLPLWAFAICLTFYGITFVPTWLWTGCLTPQYVNATMLVPNDIFVTDQAYFVVPDATRDLTNSCDYLKNGTVSNCPDIAFTGDLIRALSKAYDTRDLIGTPGWTVSGRSYGVGASAALFDGTQSTVSYLEVGLLTTVDCYYNTSANWQLGSSLTATTPGSGVPNSYQAHGKRPNDNWASAVDLNATTAYYTWDFSNTTAGSIVAFSAGGAGSHMNGTPPYQLSVAAGSEYDFLNQTQCDLTFVPTSFNVSLDLINAVISVAPLQNATIPHQQSIIEMGLRRLQGITQVETTLYTSVVGQALATNAEKIVGQFNPSGHDDSVVASVEVAIENAMDDILFAMSSYTQLKGNKTADVAVVNRSIALGSPKFHASLAAMNFAALVAIIAVMIWTKAFEHSPAFDFSDLVAMVIAAHNGVGTDVIRWNGDPHDKKLDKMHLDMRNKIGVSSPPVVTLQPI